MKIEWSKWYFDDDEKRNVNEVLQSGWMSIGPKTKEFEEKMAEYVGVKYAIAVNSGTAALDVALKALDIKPQDEVIVPALTYIATANAVLYQGATPVFADVDPRTYTIDPADIEKKITKRTKCIIPVDYAGQGPDYDQIKRIAKKYKLFVVEDGAPGLFGEYKGKPLCSFGDMAITSFHAAKIVSTIEGGMFFTNSKKYYEKARIIRWQGEDPNRKYIHPLLGFNFRMTDINAAIGLAQIQKHRVKAILDWRRNAALYYLEQLKGIKEITLPYVAEYNKHAWFLFPVLLKKRDKINQYLLDNGIKANISWPLPIYRQKPYAKFRKHICPISERITKQVLCLPLFYQITREDQDLVIKTLKEAVKAC